MKLKWLWSKEVRVALWTMQEMEAEILTDDPKQATPEEVKLYMKFIEMEQKYLVLSYEYFKRIS